MKFGNGSNKVLKAINRFSLEEARTFLHGAKCQFCFDVCEENRHRKQVDNPRIGLLLKNVVSSFFAATIRRLCRRSMNFVANCLALRQYCGVWPLAWKTRDGLRARRSFKNRSAKNVSTKSQRKKI